MSTATTVEGLKRALGDAQVVADPARLSERRHDYWMISHLRDRRGTPAPAPACVVRPRSAADVQAAIRFAAEHGVPVIPFGLGSGVVGGVIARPDAIVIDLSGMNRVRAIDPVNLLASFDAGKNGAEAEAAVAEQGLTIGHWPQSVAVSSVGGWVATRASGQFSTANGNIEDIVHSIEAVLPNGALVVLGRGPRASAGPDLRHLMLGSEGTLGVITGVTVSLRRAAEARALSAYETATMQAGFDLQREIVQRGWRPPVMRQYDERESRRLDGRLSRCALLMVHEGPAALVAAETTAIAALAAEMGTAPAPADVVEHWLEHRNNVPPWDSILERNMVADTVEVSAGWDAIGKVYDDAVASLKEIPGCLAASAHSSHVYRSGLNLYFTFAVLPPDPADMESAYFEAWKRIMQATDRRGGSLSHHHGIGRARRDYLARELGPEGVALLKTVKAALDPKGIMNPGVLLPDA
ncbi:MAG TPA: FAD-binding oxidoreductase [Caulobacteraceae bacterium]|nr:FAD-binding oxidoreductase [Caulobacteraceae bacterium]